MRNSLLLLITLCAHGMVAAQDAMDQVAVQTCKCVATTDTTLATEEWNMAFGVCVLQSAEPYKKELKKKYKIDLDHMDKDAESFGRQVGFRMATQCPEVMTKIARRKSQAAVPPPPPPPVSNEIIRNFTVQQVPGELVTVRSGQFLTMVILAADGRTLDLLLLGQADNVANLLRGTDQGRGATGIWSYTVEELFDPASRTFKPFYVITGFKAQ